MTDHLRRLRSEIDAVDERLIELLAERARLTRRVGSVKEAEGLPLYVPERESALLAARREAAARAGLDPSLVEDLLRRMIRDSYVTQDARMAATGDPSRPVVIVGGRGAFGRCLGRFFARSGYPLRELGIDDWDRAETIVDDAGLVLLAVPIDRTEAVIERLPRLPDDCVLADVTSVKRGPLDAMLRHHHGPVVGLHPMFGPDVDSLAKQVVVACAGRDDARCRWVLEQFGVWGAVVREETAEAHDRAMSTIQAMRHFTTMVYGVFLDEQEADLDELLRLSSPIYRLELTMVGRLFAQSPQLYTDIMLNAENLPDLGDRYRTSFEELQHLVREGDRDALIARFEKAARHFGPWAETLLRESRDLLRKAHDGRDPHFPPTP